MQDRVPTPGKENRVRIRLDDGQTIEGVFEYADEAIVQGSAYNKENVLPDDVCVALGIDTSSELKDALNSLVKKIDSNMSSVLGKFITGTFTGNRSSQKIKLGRKPLFVAISCNSDVDIFYYSDTLALNGMCCSAHTYSGSPITFDSTGFTVRYFSKYDTAYQINGTETYTYFAVVK